MINLDLDVGCKVLGCAERDLYICINKCTMLTGEGN